MKISLKKQVFLLLILICLILSIVGISMIVFQSNRAYAMEQDELIMEEESITLFSGSGERSSNAILISGKNNYVDPFMELPISNFEDVQYISNSNYFLINPKHHVNDGSDNHYGTCTTVAVQMLLGYHNYYSDRRIIPATGNGRTFLNSYYGKLEDDPVFHRACVSDQGCEIIGTEDGLYEEIFDRTFWAEFPGLGQAVGVVKDGAVDFINSFTAPDARDGITLTSGFFSASTARGDIDAGIPIVLGMDKLFDGNFHVVPAYGYAKLDGVDGFLVHYGWGDGATQVWVPESWFGFQIRMSVAHDHTLVDTGNIIKDTQRELYCTTCGYKCLDSLYDISDSKITNAKYPLVGSITIPDKIDIYSENTASFTTQNITEIGNNTFEKQTQITKVTLNNVTSIGDHAFSGCSALTTISSLNYVTSIGDGAFTGCNNLNITVSSINPNFSAQGNILYNKSKTQIIAAGKVSSTVDIPVAVVSISPYAFASNRNIYTVNFKSTPKIGDYAFADCVNLNSVCFDTYTVPVVGKKVFEYNNFNIYVPYVAQSEYKAAFAEYSSKIKSKEIAVSFVSDGVTISTQHLYYGSDIDFFTPKKSGYDFGGWYSNSNFTGTPYKNGDKLEEEGRLTVYAKWTPKNYTITLDPNGGTITGNKSLSVTYGSKFKTTASATRTGYTFDGWYDSKKTPATQYITTAGESTRGWDIDKEGEIKLFAHWTIESYEIQINDNGTITWLGASGLSDTSCTIAYGTVLSAINLVPTFKASNHGFKEGRIFDHFEYNDSTINWQSIPDLGDNGAVITIKPVWILEVHTIYFNTNCNTTVDPIEAEYNANINLPNTARKGYIFGGWYTNSTLSNKVNWVKMPDLTPDKQNNGSTQLYAKWTAVVYTISYLPNGAKGTSWSDFHTYDISLVLHANTFTREGYDFAGWATSATGNVVYTDKQTVRNLSDKQAGNVNLYAVWQPKKYSIICKNLATNMFVDIDTYTYGEGLEDIMPTLYKRESIYNIRVEEFYGWYTTDKFTTKVTSISKTNMGDVTLYAKYDYLVGTSFISSGTVTDSNIYNQPYVSLDLYLNSFRYDIIKSTTLKKIKIKVSLNLWEEDDGYQDFYLYDESKEIKSKTIEHGAGKKDTTPRNYAFEFELNLFDYLTVDHLYLRLGAHGAFSDTWKFEKLNVEVYFTN